MLPAVLLSVSIALLLLRTEPHVIMFAMLGTIPTALLWWVLGWQSAAVYLAGYFVVRAFRRTTA
jgi:hypothetical protein